MASGSMEQSETDSTETLVSKRNSTSAEWNYFGFKKEDAAQRQVLCRTCSATVHSPRGKRRRGLLAVFSRPELPRLRCLLDLKMPRRQRYSYLMIPAIDGEEDPLAWWRVHKISYPQLCRMARKNLCTPATSSPSEHLFSTGGNIVTCTHASLQPAKVNMLVFLTKNLWAFGKEHFTLNVSNIVLAILK